MNAKAESWHARAAALRFDGRAFIGGRRVAPVAGETFDCVSPIDGRTLTPVARGRAADIDAAVAAARAAFEDRRWAGQPPAARKKVLQRFAEKILGAREELALLETLDMGKPIQYSLAVDVPATARCIAWYGEAIDKVYDEIAPTGASALALIQREPMGVIGAVVPWNYPMIMAAWKLGPALATGNSVVNRPASRPARHGGAGCSSGHGVHPRAGQMDPGALCGRRLRQGAGREPGRRGRGHQVRRP